MSPCPKIGSTPPGPRSVAVDSRICVTRTELSRGFAAMIERGLGRGERSGHRRTGGRRVGGRRRAPERHDADARSGDVEVVARVAEGGVREVGVDRRDRDRLGVRGGVHRRVAGFPVVAAGGEHDVALAIGVLDRLLDSGRLPPTETQVDDPGAVIGSPDDPLGDVGGDPPAARVEHADRQDLDVGSCAGDADAVVDVRGDHSGNVRAVTVGVDAAVATRLHVVDAGEHRTGELLVVGLHSGVDHCDLHALTAGHGPRLLEGDLVERPLLRAQRVVLAAAERVHGLVALDADHGRCRGCRRRRW